MLMISSIAEGRGRALPSPPMSTDGSSTENPSRRPGLHYVFVVTSLRMKIRFEWDPVKADSNRRKHGVSFETALRIFADPFALTEQDRIEGGEQRWQTLGMVEGYFLLLVAHTIGSEDEDGQAVEVIRIISARRANRTERRRYEQENR